ncbi:IcmF-related protein [Rhodovastum atsumiense]|uniref:Type VI secretion system membrane subunit TssM n=1 Tax=Rhodovastum atsumiense TaxID=504468 RepID=A0A5M6IWV4_9PROT|nr:type VI secretion system membrane subunit TssM [Rhodovastum atsumiense]KAA5612721.1 type VI secretion system membrane subunit TssM [Rhodovastum atsumiense]CAH2602725.1 IcmF-related protein [Rhodovastum atsumiense]
MQGLSSLAALLLNRWTSGLAGVATAGLLVWYLGPLLPGFAGPLPRALLILLLVLLWAGVNGVLSWRTRRRNRALAAAMTDAAGGDRPAREAEADAAEEVAMLRDRMRAALARLGARRDGRGLYERPWFVLIGPPGSGKTTALRNSGLHFPLEAEGEDGPGAIGGVGGTRLCDWWFADEAVLIDTAGRYTTQDSDAVVDRAGWLGFLDILRRTRPRQPLNGIIVVISLPTLAAAEVAERRAHARAIRRRIDEIGERLKLRLPVYVVFSKADRIAGFDAWFDDLDREARAQVWGATFPLAEGVDSFAGEFRLLLERLDRRLVERLQAERTTARRGLIAGFPLQVASLARPLTDFMLEAFTGSRLAPAPFLRGAYLTSATQEGTPLDRITGLLARSFGIDQQRVASLRPAEGRSYFVAKLLREVILGEALLATHRPGRIRRQKLLRLGGFAAIGLVTLAGAALLWQAQAANDAAVQRAGDSLAANRARLAGMVLDPVTRDDLPQLAALLDAMAPPPPAPEGAAAFFGLSQAGKLAEGSRLAYRHALERLLLPRLVWRIEQQMRARFDDPDFLYQATRAYLMLGGAGPLDPAVLRGWLQADWQARFPGTLNAALRGRLLAHLDALLAEPLPPVTLDGALVEAARATFSRVTLAARVHGRLRATDAAARLPAWTPAMALGEAGARFFLRPSGRPLTEGIPGFLTGAGLREAVLRDLPAATRAVAGESWVLGRAQEIPTEGPAVAELEQAVLALWATEAQQAWDALLGDIALAPVEGREGSIESLYVLGSPQSPMRDLLAAIAGQLALDPPAPEPALAGIAAHFQALRDLTARPAAGQPGAGQPTPLDGVLRLINQLQQALAQASPGGAPVPATLQAAGDPAQLLLAEAGRQPAPLALWLRQIAATGRAGLSSAARAAAAAAFAGSDGPAALCRSVVNGRYPFDSSAAEDAPIDDFIRLFAPGGLLDSFFQSELRPYVDTSGEVWQARSLGGVAPPADAATVAAFQRAATIRAMFFPAGGAAPQLHFSLAPDPTAAAAATLRLGQASLETGTTAASAGLTLSWPGSDGMASAALAFGSGPPAIETHGPWALFRLLDQGTAQPAGTGQIRLRFAAGGRDTAFLLRPGSARHPFARNPLRGFRCPVIRQP